MKPDKTSVLHKITPTKLVSWFLLALGLIALAISIVYASSILAFIGLGLTFWGTLTLCITTEKYVKQTLLDPSIIPSTIKPKSDTNRTRIQRQRHLLTPQLF